MSHTNKSKNKKVQDKQSSDELNSGDKTPKIFRLSFRNKSKKDKNVVKKDEDVQLVNGIDSDYVVGAKNGNQRNDKCDELSHKDFARADRESDNVRVYENQESAAVVASDVLNEIINSVLNKNICDMCNELKDETSDRVGKDQAVMKPKIVVGSNVTLRKKGNNSQDKQKKMSHRRTSVTEEPLFVDPYVFKRDPIRKDSLYSVEEFDEDLDENENSWKTARPKRPILEAINTKVINKYVRQKNKLSESMSDLRPNVKKKAFSIRSFFAKNKNSEKTPPSSVQSNNLVNSVKYASAMDLSDRTLIRTPSFMKRNLSKLVNKDPELKRSMSVRDVSKKKEKTVARDKLTVLKTMEWAKSLQSLVENDNYVSYDDMSFINYDKFNTLSYEEPRKSINLHRTQSLIVHGSPNRYKSVFSRGSSVPGHYQSAVDLSEQSEALSLPSLHHIIRENEENVYDTSPSTRYRRRPQSVCSEDGKPRTRGNGSFRSAGSGCAKLKRTNACRQKSRDVIPITAEQIHNNQTRNKDDSSDSSKSVDRNDKKEMQKSLTRQKSVESNATTRAQDFLKGLTSKDKSKSVSVKNICNLASPSSSFCKGVRKTDKMSSDNKSVKINVSHKKSKKEERNANRDDFLKATMRIFLVVSPPVGKIQVRSRSLNHLDSLEMRYGVPCDTDTTLKDSRSEPDCTKPLLAPPPSTPVPPSPTGEPPSTRRHMLSRSQKSSSECFSVNFEVGEESTLDTELIVPAVRGVTLYDALAKLCEVRSIDLSFCDVWLQDKESNTNTWLGLTQDTASLVGRHIRITAKDSSNKKSSSFNNPRKISSTYRPKTANYFNSSTEDNTAPTNWQQEARLSFQESDSNKKQTKQRWSGLFGNNKDTKMESLVDHLNNYTKQGVPTSLIYPQGQCESLDALYKLEDDWSEIIDSKDLTDKQQQQQIALWELIKTEVAYIKTLKVVTDLFLACLKNLQSVNLLKEIDTEKLFSNITEILDTNVLFWRNSLFPLVRDMRRFKQPPCIENMLDGFLKMKDTFYAYFRYCAEQSRCQHYCRENHAHNELFTAYLAWCETQKECNRLRLMDILVQPMQRLTKYGLLLKAILKNTDEEVERDNLGLMIKSVDDFVNNVNSSLRQKQDNERLRGLIARIESYDIVESKDDDLEKLLKTYNQLDLSRPMINCPPERRRHLLLEGDLKLKDSNTSKMEVHCFLLTDMLLVCKPSTKKGGATMRVIRQPYLVDRLVAIELNKETPSLAIIYKNEFDMAVAAFILQNTDARKLKSWKDSIMKAQALYAQAKQLSYVDESLDAEYSFSEALESDYHSMQLAPRSPLASSSRASRVSSLAHSHSGSVEMNDQSSVGSGKDHSRAVSVENENRTGSISSDEGVQPLPTDKSPVSQKNSFKHRLFNKTPNTLSVQPYANLGQSLPNLTLGSPNVGTLSLNLNQNTLSVPSTKTGGHLLSPTHRGISYPPPSPTRGNLRRGLAISQSKNPPLIKTRHVNSTSASTSGQVPSSFDFVPVIAGVTDQYENFSRGQHRQAMLKRVHRTDNKRYHTAGIVDDIKRDDNRDVSIHKRLSWNCSSQDAPPPHEDHT